MYKKQDEWRLLQLKRSGGSVYRLKLNWSIHEYGDVNMGITRKDSQISEAAIGAVILAYIIAYTIGSGSVLYKTVTAFAAPFVFMYIGFHAHYISDARSLLRSLSQDAAAFCLPALYGTLLDVLIRFWYEETVHKMAVFISYMREWLTSFLYCFRDTIGGSPGIGIFWIFIAAFITKILVQCIVQVSDAAFGKHADIASCLIMFYLGGLGVWLGTQYFFLWVEVDVALAGLLFSGFGVLLRIIRDKWEKQRYETNYGAVIVLVGSLIISIVFIIVGIVHDQFPDIAGRIYNGILYGIPFILACLLIVCILTNMLSRYDILNKWLSMVGRHGLLYLVVYHFHHLFNEEYRSDITVLNVMGVIVLTAAISELILGIADRIVSLEKLNDDIVLLSESKKGTEIIYYISLALIYSYQFFTTTMLYQWNKSPFRLFDLYHLALCLCLFCCVSSLIQVKETWLFLLAAGILVSSQIIGFTHVDFSYAAMAMCIIGIIGRSFYTAGVISTVAGFLWTYAAYYAAMHGYVSYIVTNTGRYAFGSIDCLNFAAHLLFLLLTICCLYYLRSEKTRKRPLYIHVLILALFLFSNRYVKARADEILMLVLLIGTVAYLLGPWKNNIVLSAEKILSAASIPVFVVFAAISIIASWSFNSAAVQKIMNSLSRITDMTSMSSRLTMGWMGLKVYGIKPFGSLIYEQGFGAGATVSSQQYFFLDSAYLQLGIKYGWIYSSLLLILLTTGMYFLWKKKLYYLIFLEVIAAAAGISEHHMIEISFNILPLLMLSKEFGMVSTADYTDDVEYQE